MLEALKQCEVLGTILIANEGINVALAGPERNIEQACNWFRSRPPLHDIWFKSSLSSYCPFSKLKVRIRPEIIAFDGGQTKPLETPAPALKPAELKQWLDEGREFILLDTRNNYETDSGTFSKATKLDLQNFRDFPRVVNQQLERAHPECRDLPVVTFCTGGVRCEKAAPWLLSQGYSEVYQVDGGILNYFEQCGEAHWEGDCFVFDDRVEIDPKLNETGATLCSRCHRAASAAQQNGENFAPDPSCADCITARYRAAAAAAGR